MTITKIGIDIGKFWFHIIGLNRAGKPVLKEKRQRSNLMTLFVNTPPCLIGMEACPGSQRLARALMQIIDTLDTVRTAEAHGTGTLRKSSLSMFPLHESKDAWLINHWNIATGFTHRLRRTLLDLAE